MPMFGPPKLSAFGSFGEFTIGSGANAIRARYLLTKMKPGNDGTWECELASRMVPWREIFDIEELSFDELLQRDLDDSRVAHDLIPYLLGEKGDNARFFPPILSVIVPKKDEGTGIKGFYPQPTPGLDQTKTKFGELFDFEQLVWGSEPTPLAQLNYNPQRAAFIIVDGQHRAMAVLALHRQLMRQWQDSVYESYYDHIDVTADQVKSIELPVCVVFFPELFDGGPFQSRGIDLKTVCREIFLVVNRHAKPVSKSRELLLDDEDIPARLMRQTLSKLKNRSGTEYSLARIYCISYDESDDDDGKQVISGQIEYSTAVALHKIQAAISFGQPDAFSWANSVDVSSGKHARNPNRPAEILIGTPAEHLRTVSRRAGKALPPDDIAVIVEKLGSLADSVLLGLFDRFRPFAIHNSAMRTIRARLNDPHIKADPIQKKCLSLMFEGSGTREVFFSHLERLKETRQERVELGQAIEESLAAQIGDCESVIRALGNHEQELQRRRACDYFQIDQAVFYANETNAADQRRLEDRARRLYQSVATQAFQLGYSMAVFTVLEELRRKGAAGATPLQYDQRKDLVEFLSHLYLTALNRYFSPEETSKHRSLTGFFEKSRAAVFDGSALGLRGLLSMRGGELNEKQWPFFRYLTFEVVHSKHGWEAATAELAALGGDWKAEWYKLAVPTIVDGILHDRKKYVDAAVDARLSDQDFKNRQTQARFEAQGAGKTTEEIDTILAKMVEDERQTAIALTESHLKASLGGVEDKNAMIARLTTGW